MQHLWVRNAYMCYINIQWNIVFMMSDQMDVSLEKISTILENGWERQLYVVFPQRVNISFFVP